MVCERRKVARSRALTGQDRGDRVRGVLGNGRRARVPGRAACEPCEPRVPSRIEGAVRLHQRTDGELVQHEEHDRRVRRDPDVRALAVVDREGNRRDEEQQPRTGRASESERNDRTPRQRRYARTQRYDSDDWSEQCDPRAGSNSRSDLQPRSEAEGPEGEMCRTPDAARRDRRRAASTPTTRSGGTNARARAKTMTSVASTTYDEELGIPLRASRTPAG